MWLYRSPIGNIYIKSLPKGRYGMIYGGIVWEFSDTPHAEAHNVFIQCTGCSEWDLYDTSNVIVPKDLSEWEYILSV